MLKSKVLGSLGAIAVAGLLVSGCSEQSSTASGDTVTEDGLQISGNIAAQVADVSVEDASGTIVAEASVTEGEYEAVVDPEKVAWPITIIVEGPDGEEIETLIPRPEAEVAQLKAHINAISDILAKMAKERLEWQEMSEAKIDSIHRAHLDALLGEGVDPEEFLSKEDAEELEAAILAAIEEMSERRQEARKDFLAKRAELEAKLLEKDTEFQTILAAKLEERKLNRDQIREQMRKMMANNESGRAEIQDKIEGLRQEVADIIATIPECHLPRAGALVHDLVFMTDEVEFLQSEGVEPDSGLASHIGFLTGRIAALDSILTAIKADEECAEMLPPPMPPMPPMDAPLCGEDAAAAIQDDIDLAKMHLAELQEQGQEGDSLVIAAMQEQLAFMQEMKMNVEGQTECPEPRIGNAINPPEGPEWIEPSFPEGGEEPPVPGEGEDVPPMPVDENGNPLPGPMPEAG